MPLLHRIIRPIRLTPAHVRTAVARTVRTLDDWTLVAFNPAPVTGGRPRDAGRA